MSNCKRGIFPQVWPAQLANPAGCWKSVKVERAPSVLPMIVLMIVGILGLILGSFLVEPKATPFSGLQICKPQPQPIPQPQPEPEPQIEPQPEPKAEPKTEVKPNLIDAAIAVAKAQEFVSSSNEETMRLSLQTAIEHWESLGETQDDIQNLVALYYVETRYGVKGKICRDDTGACGHFQIVPKVWKKLFGQLKDDIESQAEMLIDIREHLKTYSADRWKAYYALSFKGAQAAIKSGKLSAYEVRNNKIESEIKALLK